jgi:hypothetical protein
MHDLIDNVFVTMLWIQTQSLEKKWSWENKKTTPSFKNKIDYHKQKNDETSHMDRKIQQTLHFQKRLKKRMRNFMVINH